MFSVLGSAFDDSEISFVSDAAALELAVERGLGDFCTQSRSLALVVEDCSVESAAVLSECKVAPDRSPKTGTVARNDSHFLSFDIENINGKLELRGCVCIAGLNLLDYIVLFLEVGS